MKRVSQWMLLAALGLAAILPVPAQGFGQNKISYKRFDWKVYQAPHFDVHYYGILEKQLATLVSELESAYLDVSRQLDHEVRSRVPVVLYATHTDFEQTNVSLEEIDEGVGAFAEPFGNRMVIPVDQPTDFRYALIKHELTHIFEFEIFYGGSLRRTLRARPPLWLMEGLASYIGNDEDSLAQMVIRDGVVNNLVPSIERMPGGYLAYRYGHAVFDFIEGEYGREGLRTFLFEFRKSLLANSLEKAFQDAFGLSVDQFDRRFARYLRTKYLPVLTGKRAPEEYGKEIGLTRPGRYTFSPTLSPSGELVAALATPKLELDVVIINPQDGKVIRNLTKGFTNRYTNIVAEAFDGQRDLSWSPDGDRLAFFVRRENRRELLIYDPIDGDRVARIPITEIAGCASPSYAPDGQWIAFSGNKDGQWDIFRIHVETRQIENLTQDEYYDTNPMWSSDGSKLLYNRRIGSFAKIFTVDAQLPERKAALTTGAASDLMPSFSRDGKAVYFASDRGEYGVFNIHKLDLETGSIERLTDLTGGAFAPVEMSPTEDGAPQLAIAAYQGGTFRLYRMKTSGEEVEAAKGMGQKEPQTSPLAASRKTLPAEKSTDGTSQEPPPAPEPEDDLQPFEAPLQLTLDADKSSPYKLKWNVDVPDISVGVTDDGSLLSNVAVNFADTLGDHRLSIRSYSVSSFSNTVVSYFNLKRRLDWGASVFDFRDYYYANSISGVSTRVQQRQRLSGLSAFAQLPFNRYYRMDGDLGYIQRRYSFPFLASNGQVRFDELSSDYVTSSIDFVGDTTRWQNFGPFQGHRFRIGPFYNFKVSGDDFNESYGGLSWDFRGYQKATTRSLFAVRYSGVLQNNDSGNLYAIGGINQLRGAGYRDFFGTNYSVLNLEFRFPLLEAIVFPGGSFGFTPVRGFFFIDAGSAWFDDLTLVDPLSGEVTYRGKVVYDRNLGNYRPYERKGANGLYRDLHVFAGFGVWMPILGLPCNWSFSKEYDGDELGPWHSNFYIVFDW